MSEDIKRKIEIDARTIENISVLCGLSGLEVPEVITGSFIESAHKRVKEILLNLKKQSDEGNSATEKLTAQVKELNNKINNLKEELRKAKRGTPAETEKLQETTKPETSAEEKSLKPRDPKAPDQISDILIIANLGVIMHQLKILFSKAGCKATLVKSYSEAIGELKERSYDCILFDMSTTTENELMLVEALRKATEICHSNTLILVLTIPSKDKKFLDKIKAKGADIIVEKHESWHMNILTELKLVS
jgi:PleD family two-component response regulator